MPFPPNFDHAWDITQPPDTQLANLLGLDIRNLKDDIMQRMSLLSGTLANRPTPETVNATWGGAGFGLIYIATDTNQTFQWNGSAWVGLQGGFSDYDDYTPVQFIGAAPGLIRTNTIPIGAVQTAQAVGSYIEVDTSFNISGSTGASPNYRIQVNGTNVLLVTFGGNAIGTMHGIIALSNAANPRAIFSLDYGGVWTQQRSTAALGTMDGTAPITITDSFGGSTTITATGDFMHIRVRK